MESTATMAMALTSVVVVAMALTQASPCRAGGAASLAQHLVAGRGVAVHLPKRDAHVSCGSHSATMCRDCPADS